MARRSRTRCTENPGRPRLPARRAACRSPAAAGLDALLGAPERMYVAVQDGETALVTVDVLGGDGTFLARFVVDGADALAAALLRDATGHPPRPATTSAFAHEIVERHVRDGFAISSTEVCAWLLLRAIERSPHNT
jgi:hypothetical protein